MSLTCYANFPYGVHKSFIHPKFQRSASLVSRDPTTEVNVNKWNTSWRETLPWQEPCQDNVSLQLVFQGKHYLDKNRVRICSNWSFNSYQFGCASSLYAKIKFVDKIVCDVHIVDPNWLKPWNRSESVSTKITNNYHRTNWRETGPVKPLGAFV